MTVIIMSHNEPTRLSVLIDVAGPDACLFVNAAGLSGAGRRQISRCCQRGPELTCKPRPSSERIQFTCTFEGHQIGVDEMKKSALSAARSVSSFRIDNLRLSSAVPMASSKPSKSANMVRCSAYEGGLRSGIAWFLGLL